MSKKLSNIHIVSERNLTKEIIGLQDDIYFASHRKLLFQVVNTDYGRELLGVRGVPRECLIVSIKKDRTTHIAEDGQSVTNYYSGSSFADIIRFRWKEFVAYAKRFYDRDDETQIFLDGAWKWAATTSTYKPDASPGATYDGYTINIKTNETWTNIIPINGAGTNANSTGNQLLFMVRWHNGTTVSRFDRVYVAAALFDTDDLDGETISSAKVYTSPAEKTDPDSNSPNCAVYRTTTASDTAATAGDYENIIAGEISDILAYGDMTVGADGAEFTLNATGRDYINKTGITKLAFQNEDYVMADVQPTATTSGGITQVRANTAEGSEPVKPRLEVIHTTATGIVPFRRRREGY